MLYHAEGYIVRLLFYLKNITRGYGSAIVSFAIYFTLLFDLEKRKKVGHIYCHFLYK